jgi:hypothetical protein
VEISFSAPRISIRASLGHDLDINVLEGISNASRTRGFRSSNHESRRHLRRSLRRSISNGLAEI